jgi:UDP-sugar transporter A1/2/3
MTSLRLITYSHIFKYSILISSVSRHEFIHGWKDFLGLAVPSGLYVIQNNLQYVASSNLSAALFQVLSQMKIITTAIFAVIILGRRPSNLQWVAVIALTIGIAIVNLSQEKSIEQLNSKKGYAIGIACILCSSCTSGFAGIYFEKMVKNTSSSIWIRNIQMSFIGLILSSIACIGKDLNGIYTQGFFKGYNGLVWSVILLQAIGGLVVAMVVKYADNILKGFATAGAIVVSCIAAAFVFQNSASESEINGMFVVGATVVCASAFVYGYSPPKLNAVKHYNESLASSTNNAKHVSV